MLEPYNKTQMPQRLYLYRLHRKAWKWERSPLYCMLSAFVRRDVLLRKGLVVVGNDIILNTFRSYHIHVEKFLSAGMSPTFNII